MKKSQGFTLIESLIAFVLIAILIITLVSVFSMQRRGMQASENRVKAAFLGRSVLEGMKTRTFDDIYAYSGKVTYTGLDDSAQGVKDKVHTLEILYNVSVEAQGADKKIVWVDLSWTERGGRSAAFQTKHEVVETVFTRLK
ncbi:MAG: prepilin-type N-terminal cleavage/methylation domain-containing protein [Candidatus Eremiobacteraeota bacterium]|nr:prepilin-type N-terminal cleavage/methylation domain-containing protein [Candidatus Eremiobacteraeota bacterium]